jgi:hypothetical protein
MNFPQYPNLKKYVEEDVKKYSEEENKKNATGNNLNGALCSGAI